MRYTSLFANFSLVFMSIRKKCRKLGFRKSKNNMRIRN